ncbi:MAG: hypothetical protein M1833_001701 [Piccolia ochrophora]|nr:MAG: hypothetical protein M1833_001701 [Piccolia ochrophora]
MSTPQHELPRPHYPTDDITRPSSDEDGTFVGDGSVASGNHLRVFPTREQQDDMNPPKSPSQAREQSSRLDDDLELLRAEQVATNAAQSQNSGENSHSHSVGRTRSRRTEPTDDFDVSTAPIHEKAALYRPPENPSTKVAKFFKKVHESSFLVRYFTYIVPVVAIILIPLLLGALLFKSAHVGGVQLMWFSVWLEIVWLTLWAGRIVAKWFPWPLGLISSMFTNNNKKWRDMGKQLEVPAAIFFWWLGIFVSFLPTMTNHHIDGNKAPREWESTMNKVLIAFFVGAVLNFFEKIIIQLIAISFHLRTYSDRIEVNKFQIASLAKLYKYSKEKIEMDDSEFEENDTAPSSGAQTPMAYLNVAQKGAKEAFSKVGDAAGKIAGDFTGRQVTQSTHPNQVVLTLLANPTGSQVLARRLYRTFGRQETQTVHQEDLKAAFDNDEESDAAFQMFDKDLNGDISMEELEAVCVEIGRERKSITASLKDLDSVVSKLDSVLFFVVVIITLLVLLSLTSVSAAGVLTSAGSTLLALSWLFAATAQEFLQSVIFVFVKHPFDVGDRVAVYGNTGSKGLGDDYLVKKISLLYTEFKKLEGQIVQAPNSYLNTLFILNMRRSGGLAEAVPLTVKFGTTLEQIDALRQRLLDFVTEEKREYQGKILTELREVVEAHAITINVVFFYKSNWQNELLRLQRRNKFICAMMVSMQELGIEGPRMRYPGQKETSPVYLHNLMPMNSVQSQGDDPYGGSDRRNRSQSRGVPTEQAGGNLQQSPSILRPDNGSGRNRGESASAMSKRVDFSLGMKGMSSGGMMEDLYDDRSKVKLPPSSVGEGSRSRTRSSSENQRRENIGLSTSNDTATRVNSDSQSRMRSTQSTHRNRFFGRGKKQDGTGATEGTDLESGFMADIPEGSGPPSATSRMDPRTGTVSPQAVQHTNEEFPSYIAGGYPPRSAGSDSVRPVTRSTADDYEMGHLQR